MLGFVGDSYLYGVITAEMQLVGNGVQSDIEETNMKVERLTTEVHHEKQI